MGSGLGAALEAATKVISAMTLTAASALTMIHGSLDDEALGVGFDTITPHRKSLRGGADRTSSLSLAQKVKP